MIFQEIPTLRSGAKIIRKSVKLLIEKLGLTALFDALIDGGMISRSKPDPEVFLKAAAALALPPACSAVVEDAQSGIEAARRGGFRAIAYTPTPRRLTNADAEIHTLTELLV